MNESAGDVPDDIEFGTEEEWAEVYDCYGPSTSTPRTLKKLFAADAETHERAVHWLYAALFHQGGRFEATIKAVPLLFDILEHPACPLRSRAFLFEYLVSLAYGFPDEIAFTGINPPAHLAALDAQIAAPRGTITAHERLEPYCDTYTARDLYREIQARRARLYPFIHSADPAVAAAALTAVSLLAADDAELRAQVHRMLDDKRPIAGSGEAAADAIEPVAACLLAAGTMARAMGLAPPAAQIEPWLEAKDRRLRFAAALALADPERLHRLRPVLIDGLLNWDERQDTPAIRSVWCSSAQLAIEMVERFAVPSPEWIEALIENLDARGMERAMTAASMLLRMLSPETGGRFHGIEPSALTPLQRSGLEAIRDRGLWSLMDDDAQFLNFSNLMRACGLPEQRKEFAAWLAGGTTGYGGF